MAEVELVAESRPKKGSSESRRLRATGKVPAVLYGHGIEPQALAVEAKALRGALNGAAGLNALLSLKVESARHLAMARQIQRNPRRGEVTHVDFQIVRRDEVVSAEIPLRLEGEATEVNRVDGQVEQQLFSLTVHAKPGDLPPHVDVDLSGLTVGETIRVGDLRLPPGVTTDLDPDDPVVVGVPSRLAGEGEAAGEAGAGAGAEGAEGSTGGGSEAGSAGE